MKFCRTRMILACLALPGMMNAQTQGSVLVRGSVMNLPGGETFSVEARPLGGSGVARRELVSRDGSFELHGIESGTYEVKVTTSRGSALRSEVFQLDSFHNRVTIQLPDSGPSGPAGTVSIRRLAFKPSKAARKLYGKAESASDRKRAREAIALLKQVVEIEPGWAEAHNNLGAQYYRMADVRNACASFTKAWEIDPEPPEIAGNYALALIHQGRAADAERIMRRLMLRGGRTPKGQLVLAMSLAAQGTKRDEARSLLAGVADQFPTARALLSKLR